VLQKVTVEEALKKRGQRVEVEFEVKGLGIIQPAGNLELRSEKDPGDEQGLSVWLLKSELDKFPVKDAQQLLKSYSRKRIRVRGSVQPMSLTSGTRLVIEVADPGQIEVVGKGP
jgi:hypothetical protein